MLKNHTAVLLSLMWPCSFCIAQDKSSSYSKYINESDLKTHVEYLASDELEGREAGKQGQKVAALYLAEQFSNYGLKPVDGNYFQQFKLEQRYPDNAEMRCNDKTYTFPNDFYYFGGFSDTSFTINEILFLGYGIEDETYNDYIADVTGKVIMILAGEPKDKKGKSYVTGTEQVSEWTYNWRKKTELAKKKGVKAMLVVVPDYQSIMSDLNHYINRPYTTLKGVSGKKGKIPNFFINEGMCNELLSASGKPMEMGDIQKIISKKGKPFLGKMELTLIANIEREKEELMTENVVGYMEGSTKKDELIIITAHYDHLGIKDGEIYNGADDDGSGTAAILEIAQAFSMAKKDGNGPKRSILFMPVSAEEKGLLGSLYYTMNPLFPLDNVVANLNIDMIGRIDSLHESSDYVYLIGSDRHSSELHQICIDMNGKHINLDLDMTFNATDDPNRFFYRSDHYNFAKNNVPVVFFFSGVHEDYHKPTDTSDKLLFGKMEKISRLIYHTAWELANRPERIVKDVGFDGDSY